MDNLKLKVQNSTKNPSLVTRCSLLFTRKGFTLLEVMISLAIVGGLLVTLLYTLNYHLGIAERHGVVTTATILAKQKLYDIEKSPSADKGTFSKPYDDYKFETEVKESSFPGMSELSVIVTKGKERVALSELVRKRK